MKRMVLAVLVSTLVGPACAGRDPEQPPERRSKAQGEIDEEKSEAREEIQEADEEVQEGLEKARQGWRDIFN